MSDKPEFPVDIVKNTITKIATGVVSGFIFNKKTTSGYVSTWRTTGSLDIPTDPKEFVAMFLDHPDYEEISSSFPIDVYVYCHGKDGILRVDV